MLWQDDNAMGSNQCFPANTSSVAHLRRITDDYAVEASLPCVTWSPGLVPSTATCTHFVLAAEPAAWGIHVTPDVSPCDYIKHASLTGLPVLSACPIIPAQKVSSCLLEVPSKVPQSQFCVCHLPTRCDAKLQ